MVVVWYVPPGARTRPTSRRTLRTLRTKTSEWHCHTTSKEPSANRERSAMSIRAVLIDTPFCRASSRVVRSWIAEMSTRVASAPSMAKMTASHPPPAASANTRAPFRRTPFNRPSGSRKRLRAGSDRGGRPCGLVYGIPARARRSHIRRLCSVTDEIRTDANYPEKRRAPGLHRTPARKRRTKKRLKKLLLLLLGGLLGGLLRGLLLRCHVATS